MHERNEKDLGLSHLLGESGPRNNQSSGLMIPSATIPSALSTDCFNLKAHLCSKRIINNVLPAGTSELIYLTSLLDKPRPVLGEALGSRA